MPHTPYDNADVPPRVLAAERRRELRELMARSSLGCPRRRCDHPIGQHHAEDYDRAGNPIGAVCTVAGCDCGEEG